MLIEKAGEENRCGDRAAEPDQADDLPQRVSGLVTTKSPITVGKQNFGLFGSRAAFIDRRGDNSSGVVHGGRAYRTSAISGKSSRAEGDQ